MFLIRCISPQQIGSARLAVSNNGIDFSSSNVEFTYQPRMILESLSPTSATTLGGTLVSVSGTNLRSYGHPTCHFGDTHVVDAMVVSETLVKCMTPRVQKGGRVKLYISHNGIDRSKYFLNFTFNRRHGQLMTPPAGGIEVGWRKSGSFGERSETDLTLPTIPLPKIFES